MATQANLIATYNANPTLQSRYTLQEYLDMFGFGQTTTPTPDPDPTPGVTNIINQNVGRDDGPKGDFGIFGNLDKSTARDFNVEVYDEEVGDFVPTTITGYKNVNSGLYQDKFGKNLQPAFSNTGKVFGLAGIAAQALGLTPDTVGGYVPGSIKGKYDGITDMFGSAKNIFQQKKIREQQSIQQELAKQAIQKQIAEAEAAERARIANQQAVTYQYNNPSAKAPQDGVVRRDAPAYTGGGANVAAANYTSTGREGFGYGLADGGRVYLYNRLK